MGNDWVRAAAAVLCVAATGCATNAPPLLGPRGYAGETPQAEAYNHYLAGVFYSHQGAFDRAADELEAAISLSPQSVRLYIELILTYQQMDDPENARDIARLATERWPEDAALWIVLGWLNQKLDRHDDAVAAYRRAVALEPSDARGYAPLIRATEDANDLITAIDVYRQLIDLRPESPLFHLQLGINLIRISDLEPAAAALERALVLEPGLLDARRLLSLVYLDMDRPKAARDACLAYLRAQPDDPGVRENLAAAYGRLAEWEKALQQYGLLMGEPGADPVHVLGRVYVLMRLERFRDAAATAPSPDAPIIGALFRGLALEAAGASGKTVLGGLGVIESDLDIELHEFLIELILLFGKAETGPYLLERMQAAREGGVRDPAFETIHGRLLMLQERTEEAERILTGVLDAHSSYVWAHYYLATLYEGQGRWQDAEPHLLECLRIDPLNPEYMNFLGYMYAEENVKIGEAERLIQQALDIEPGNPYYLDSLGWVYYRRGDAGKAIELIRKAIFAMESDDAVLRDHLGDAYFLKGDVEKAVGEWERAIRLDPTLEGVRQKLEDVRQ